MCPGGGLASRLPVNTILRERRARAITIYHFVIIDSLYAVALHFLSVCPVKRPAARFDSVKPLAGFRAAAAAAAAAVFSVLAYRPGYLAVSSRE